MEGKGGPEEVRSEEKEEDSKEGEKKEEEAKEDVISLHGKEEEGLQRKCLTGWINYQLSRHPRPPQGRVTDILHDLRSGLLLISLLEVLVPGLQAAKESEVHLRIHRLANLATVLATLQKERVPHLEKIVADEVEAGHPGSTLALLWALVKHYQFRQVCLATGLNPAPAPDTLLLAWARSAPGLEQVTDLSSQWTDGLALCRLALHHDVAPTALTAALQRPPARRIPTVLQTLQTSRLLPPGLIDSDDLVDGRLDKFCCMTALLCLFQALRPTITQEMVEGVEVASDPSLTTNSSPTRHLPDLPSDLPPAGWTNVLEEVLSWLLEAEDHLLSLHSLGQKQLETVRQRFYNHEDFMLELQSHQGAVRKVLDEGRRLAGASNPEQQQDIRVQMKLLSERWEKVRSLAMAKQAELSKLVTELQRGRMDSLVTWMGKAEAILASLAEPPGSREELAEQCGRKESLLEQLEEQQATVSSISHFILVESEETKGLEEELALLGERWHSLCRGCEERHAHMEMLASLWAEVNSQGEEVARWMADVEMKLRKMELEEEVEGGRLEEQERQVREVEAEVGQQRSRLDQVGNASQRLQETLGPVVAGEAAAAELEKLQDRWDILIEILEAQKLRISSLGQQFKSKSEDWEGVKVGNVQVEVITSSREEVEVEVKKRKVEKSKRESFNGSYVQISSWAEHILSRLENGLSGGLEVEDQRFLHEETEAEVRQQREKVEQLVKDGEALILGDEEGDVRVKVERAREQLAAIQGALQRLKEGIDHQAEKRQFYSLLQHLHTLLDSHSNLDDLLTAKEGLHRLNESEGRLQEVKQLAVQLESCGEGLDPGNTVSEDCKRLSDRVDEVKTHLRDAIERLEGKGEETFTVQQAESSSATSDDCDTIEDTVVIQSEASEEGVTCASHSKVENEAGREDEEVEEEETVYHSSPNSSATGLHVFSSSTSTTGAGPSCMRAEVFLTVAAVGEGMGGSEVVKCVREDKTKGEEDKKERGGVSEACREPCQLELDLQACLALLQPILVLEDTSQMEELAVALVDHQKLLSEVFVPASFSEEEASKMVQQVTLVKEKLASREKEVQDLTNSLQQWREEVGGLHLWMREVEVFLHAEDAALGDLATLEAQIKESNALQDDIETLQPNVDNINEAGESLIGRCEAEGAFRGQLEADLGKVNGGWKETVSTAKRQNSQLSQALETSMEVTSMVKEINTFLDQLEGELVGAGALQPVTAAPELSQRTFRLLQLREKTARKGEVLERLSLVEVEGLGVQGEDLGARISAVQERWGEVTGPVHSSYSKMREATTDYGEFKTLVAQESDWLDRLEKKLRRSSKAAADAEEISEELDDIENCLNNHPEERIARMRLLASGLGEKEILISPVQTEAGKLASRWIALERQARERIRSLEECIMEAQEWECKILCVQDWLAEKDMLLTSHLEHELTVDDLADETQRERMLREFEDKENLLSEMDEQVDAYRDSGKEEAAIRLEEQLSLIHTRFQELSSKFELFQQPADYDGRLNRIARQLRDIQQNMYLTELVSHERESIQGQLHHTRCIYNALADVKPEVEATIKMGRKLVEAAAVPDPGVTSANIDSLKELFNVLGAQVTEARGNLEKALEVSDSLMTRVGEVMAWLEEAELELAESKGKVETGLLEAKVGQMKQMKVRVRELLAVKAEFLSLASDPSLLGGLGELLAGLEARWSKVKGLLEEELSESNEAEEVELPELALDLETGSTSSLSGIESREASEQAEEGAALQEFREVFQEVSGWLDSAEKQLERARRASEDRQLEEQVAVLRPKVESLGTMAVRVAEQFSSQREDVHGEMVSLGGRWEAVVSKIEPGFSLVEVEQIKTTISQMVIPPSTLVQATTVPDEEEIMTLAEEQLPDLEEQVTSPAKVLEQGARSSSKEKSKSPPPTLPKPRWYVESMQAKRNGSNIPVRQVVVTSATLPSPRWSPASPPTVVVQPELVKQPSPTRAPSTEVLPASPCLEPTAAELAELEEENSRDNAIIDRLLRGASADIEDVKARSLSRGQAALSRDKKDFQDSAAALLAKLTTAQARLEKMVEESDLELRIDLIEMEVQELEAAVATTISRGETLLLIIHRQSPEQAEGVKVMVGNLRDEWTRTKQVAEKQRKGAKAAEKEVEKFTSVCSGLLVWLAEVEQRLDGVRESREGREAILRELEERRGDLELANKLASPLRKIGALQPLEASLASCNFRWDQVKELAKKSKSVSPLEGRVKRSSEASDITGRIKRVREAISAVETQLRTTVLKGRRWENLDQQDQMLTKVQSALETLKPRVRRCGQEVEGLSSENTPMEQYELLTGQAEKCRQEWTAVNSAYQERLATWKECAGRLESLRIGFQNITAWLDSAHQHLKEGRPQQQQETRRRSQERAGEHLDERILQEKEEALTSLLQEAKIISQESDQLQGDELSKEGEELGRRWQTLVADLALRAKEGDQGEQANINIIVGWAESALVQVARMINVSSHAEIREGIAELQAAQVSLYQKQVSLEGLSAQVGISSPLFLSTRQKVQRIAALLPRRLQNLNEKLERVERLGEGVQEGKRWVESTESRRRLAEGREEHLKLRLAVSDKEYSMNQLFNEFLLLEREVASGGLPVEPELSRQVSDLKESWLKLAASVRRVTNPLVLSSNNTNNGNQSSPARRILTSPDSNQNQVVSVGVVGNSPSSPSVPSSGTQGNPSSASIGNASSGVSSSHELRPSSPTTPSLSPLTEEVVGLPRAVLTSLGNKSARVVNWLGGLAEESRQGEGVRVDDVEAVGRQLDRQRALVGQLEGRRAQMEEIIATATDLHPGAEDVVNQINLLRSEWKVVAGKLLGRKAELTAMLEHSDNLDSKGKEVSEWLGRLERQLAGEGVGKTRDVLLHQIRQVNEVHRELQRYSHHVSLFTQLCHRLVSIYSRDSTAGILQLAEELGGRYSGLTVSCLARGKSLKAALEQLNSFDRELAEFLAFLGEEEAALERLEVGEVSELQLEERQESVRARDGQFCSLAGRGKEQVAAAGETDIVLASKVTELGRRWSQLQNGLMRLQDRQERRKNSGGPRELEAWLASMRRSLQNAMIPTSIEGLRQQMDEQRKLRRDLDSRRAEVLKWPGMESEWAELVEQATGWQHQLEEAEVGLSRLEAELNGLDSRLEGLEAESTAWCLPPSLDSARAELVELETAMVGLQELQEQVDATRATSSRLPPALARDSKVSEVERRLSALQDAAAARRSQLVVLQVQEEPGSQQFLSRGLAEGWERCLTDDSVPYFVSHGSTSTQWDHPAFVTLLAQLAAMNTVKFSAYRLALKLRKVQQRLCLDLLDIASAEVCFDSHGLTAEKHDLTICVPEMVTILTSIYETLHQCEPEDIDVSLCVDLALNWILNVFDSQRQGFTRVLSFKLAVVVLCRGPLLEKYSILYTLAAQGEEMLDQRRLGLLLYDLVQAPRYLGEVAQFGGSNIEPSVRSCLSVSAKEARASINQEQFLQWAKEEPQSLVWLPVLHRLASAETATHDVKCKICRVYPIVGFRYHCRKCFNLDICHGCFFVGKTYKGHKPEHPMQEYCTATNKTDNARHILQAVRNSFRSKKYFKKKQQQLGYLPVQTVAEGESFESPPSVLSPTGDFLSPNLSFESREFVPSDSVPGSVRASEDDEHSLIAAYCRLLTSGGNGNENNNIGGGEASTASILHDVDRRLDTLEQEAVEQMLEQLREENSRLEKEHRALLAGTVIRGDSTVSLQSSEEKALRQQRARLEARMAILEDHNRQLEAQLDRLRQLVTSGEGGGEVDELGSVVVVAAELKDPTTTEGKKELVVPRPAPPTNALRSSGLTVPDSGSGRSSVRDSGTSGDDARHSATSGSLDLSIHNTEVQDD